MQRHMLKSKIHRARVTEAELYYEGSLTIDEDLLDIADIKVFEKVSVVNVNNGERFETYVIPGQRGSGTICLNGAAARKAQIDDEVIIITYQTMDDEEIADYKPTLVFVDRYNKVKEVSYECIEKKVIKSE